MSTIFTKIDIFEKSYFHSFWVADYENSFRFFKFLGQTYGRSQLTV